MNAKKKTQQPKTRYLTKDRNLRMSDKRTQNENEYDSYILDEIDTIAS